MSDLQERLIEFAKYLPLGVWEFDEGIHVHITEYWKIVYLPWMKFPPDGFELVGNQLIKKDQTIERGE